MDWKKIGIIVGREYANRVKKKSFLLTTFLSPILFAGVCILPSLIMLGIKEEAKVIAVIDKSGIVLPTLEDGEAATFKDFSGQDPDSLKNRFEELGLDAELFISEVDTSGRTVTAVTYSPKPLGVDLVENLQTKVNDAVEEYRTGLYGIDGLNEILAELDPDIKLATYTLDESGEEKMTSSDVYMFVSMAFGMIIYVFIVMFGGMVMSSVIEEKSSRVVEVLISSVKATELMFGKIIGVALVALTQFFLWVVLTLVLLVLGGSLIGMDTLTAGMAATDSMMQGGMEQASPSGTLPVLSTLMGLDWGLLLGAFVVFFVFGYLLYASLFAAIGSAVENENDTTQLQIPVTIPLFIGFFLAIYCFKSPDGGVAFWGSMVPFTSPIVMMARIPFGVPAWQLILSIAILVLTFLACAWASAKIYKAGILMYGKKSTFKDLWKWLKQR